MDALFCLLSEVLFEPAFSFLVLQNSTFLQWTVAVLNPKKKGSLTQEPLMLVGGVQKGRSADQAYI